MARCPWYRTWWRKGTENGDGEREDIAVSYGNAANRWSERKVLGRTGQRYGVHMESCRDACNLPEQMVVLVLRIATVINKLQSREEVSILGVHS